MNKFLHKLPKWLKKKRTIAILGVIVLIILYLIFFKKPNTAGIQTGKVTKQDLQQTVLTTGQVVSGTDLDLSFQGSGTIQAILVKEGDSVRKGQLLAYINRAQALASLTSAQGSLAQANASYAKLVAGATPETIQTYNDSITQANQDLQNAYNGAPNALNNAYTAMYIAHGEVVTIRDTYFYAYDKQGVEVTQKRDDMQSNLVATKSAIDGAFPSNPASVDAAISQTISSLNASYNDVTVVRADADQGGYYSAVTTTDKTALDTQKASLNTALTSTIDLQHSVASYKIALQKAKDQLSLTAAPPTQAEIDLAKAQILSAQGQVDAAYAQVANLSIVAPANGTITQIDKKAGEQATALAEVMVLQDVGDLHAESDVSEANIASLQLGQSIDYTFDALGPDKHFTGKVLTINPSSTVVSGVVNYKVKGSLDTVPEIKPGMTVNMTIMVSQKSQVLAVPSTAVINEPDGKYVRVVDDPKKLTYHEVKVQTGLEADGGLIEIVSGVSQDQQIVTYIKK